jgi:hypothetical protein
VRKGCENMICGECGLRVSKFPGYRWDKKKTSYLFFRANFGDFSRLEQALIEDSEYTAYSCGCKGYDVNCGEAMPDGFKWKCSGCDLGV